MGPVSVVERLSFASFPAHGHPYHLYVYDDPGPLPPGVVAKDASEFLPRERVFRHMGALGAYADLFRWEMLVALGGWWVDADVVCLRPFDFPEERVLAREDGDILNVRFAT